MASTDGGITFDIVKSISGRELDEFRKTKAAESENLQKVTLYLNQYAGDQDIVIGFRAIHNGKNQLIIGSLELYNSGEILNQEMILDEISIFPNPVQASARIAFKLKEKQNVELSVFSLSGSTMIKSNYNNVLNQTYNLDFASLPEGIYLVNVSGKKINITRKVIIQKWLLLSIFASLKNLI